MRPPDGGIRKGEWVVQSVPTHTEVAAFIKRHHYAIGVPNTSTHRHGMYRADPTMAPMVGELCGVALWIPPTKNAALTVADEWQSVLCLSRLAVRPDLPTNAASFLLGNSMRLVHRRWAHLLTYADTAKGHTGAIYRATNWRCLGPVAAGDVWTDPSGRQWGRKRGGKTLLAEDMRAAGLVKTEAAPKIKFVHP